MLDKIVNGKKERILYKRANTTQRVIGNQTPSPNQKKGVLVIDPNKVFNDYNEIKDRYVKQEELLIYSSLKVFKNSESAVVERSDGTQISQKINEPIYINFLNPLVNRKREDGSFFNKNKFTSEWADFFASDIKDKDKPGFILDPESFGISNIDVKINANLLPIVDIEFIDVQGRMLFERGNDQNNPYNIFFTYPYPQFILTYKGYYGKAIETPLVLLKSNTRFDPATGNYTISASFQSEIFSFFNTFLLIYAYVAPYMFLDKNGAYLGGKILAELYKRQNEEIKASVGDSEYSKYDITNNPTLDDLASALKKIPQSATGQSNETDQSSSDNDKILKLKFAIESFDKEIKNFLSDTERFVLQPITSTITDQTFIANNTANEISPSTPIELIGFLDQLNTDINSLSTITSVSGNQNILDNIIAKIKNELTTNSSQTNNAYINAITPQKVITPEIFYYPKDITNKTYWITNYEKVISIITREIDITQGSIENNYVENQLKDIGKHLGYEPNLGNILRIISNNVQTFLILLEICGLNSLKQIEEDRFRLNGQKRYGDYSESFDSSSRFLTPFPNYYKEIIDKFENNQIINRTVLEYPGVNKSHRNWFEVVFIEEIYKALDRIKLKYNPELKTVIPRQKTGILSVLQLGDVDLNVYLGKENAFKALSEFFAKYNLYVPYSGAFYRGITQTNFTGNFVNSLVSYEMNLFDEILKAKVLDSNTRYTIYREFKNLLTPPEGDVTTPLSNFINKFLKLKSNVADIDNGLFDGPIKNLISVTTKSFTETEFNDALKILDDYIDVQVINKNEYNIITYKDFTNIYNFSPLNKSKAEPLELKVNLGFNDKFYADSSSTLSPVIDSFKSVESGYEDINPFQGFYRNMNQILINYPSSPDFSRTIKYFNADNIQALTFNTKIEDQQDAVSLTPISSTYKFYDVFKDF